jgi:hypothetical protein
MQHTTTVLREKHDAFRPDGDVVRWLCGVARLEVLTREGYVPSAWPEPAAIVIDLTR